LPLKKQKGVSIKSCLSTKSNWSYLIRRRLPL